MKPSRSNSFLVPISQPKRHDAWSFPRPGVALGISNATARLGPVHSLGRKGPGDQSARHRSPRGRPSFHGGKPVVLASRRLAP